MESIITKKMRFVNYISEALELDGVQYIKFIYRPGREYSEIVEVTHSDGTVTQINVHKCSFKTIYREIYKEVYGDGADGRLRRKEK